MQRRAHFGGIYHCVTAPGGTRTLLAAHLHFASSLMLCTHFCRGGGNKAVACPPAPAHLSVLRKQLFAIDRGASRALVVVFVSAYPAAATRNYRTAHTHTHTATHAEKPAKTRREPGTRAPVAPCSSSSLRAGAGLVDRPVGSRSFHARLGSRFFLNSIFPN